MRMPLVRDRSRLADAVCDIVALGLILAALVVALRTTSGLAAPNDPDHYRDVAQAQTVRDGHPLTDPYYRGEWAWYNPLLAWVLALGSALSRLRVEEFHVRFGPWANLLGPVMFYFLGIRLVGRQAALVALTLYLFFVCANEPSWSVATYSPWLFSGNFGQGIFFSAALVLVWAAERPVVPRALVAGVMIGLTFLAHTAPALILATMACILWVTRPLALFTAGLAALVVASPFLYGIGVHYHLHVVNVEPLSWRWPPITRNGLPQTLRDNGLLIAAALAGLVIAPSRFTVAWLVTAAGFLVYTVAPLPRLLPAFHFWLYTTAALMLLAGATAAWLFPRLLAVPALAVIVVAVYWPTYITRSDLVNGRLGSLDRDANHVAAVEFLRVVTKVDDVVLGTSRTVSLIIGPAGRKTVASDVFFSSPYVQFGSRAAAQDGMLVALDTGDLSRFTTLARRYGVTRVVSVGDGHCAATAKIVSIERRFGDVCIGRLSE